MHGGKRKGAGRKPGSRNKFRLQPKDASAATPTKATMFDLRRRVARLVADGMSEDDVAILMSLSVDKLRSMFEFELRYGRLLLRDRMLERLENASDSGKVPAIQALAALSASPDGAKSQRNDKPVENSEPEMTEGARRFQDLLDGLPGKPN